MSAYYYLNVPATNHHSIHLFQCQLGGFWYLVFNKSKAFVFVSDRVPRQVDRFHRSEWEECLFYCVFLYFKINAAYVDSAKKLFIA